MMKRTLFPARVAGRGLVAMALATLAVHASPLAAQQNAKLAPYSSIPGAEKVSLHLLEAAQSARLSKSTLRDEALSPVLKKGAGGVVVEIVAGEVTGAFLQQLEKLGVTVKSHSALYRQVLVEVEEPDALLALAAMENVLIVRPQYPAKTNAEPVKSQAAEAMRATEGVAKYGVDGSGVTVGILSDSFVNTIDEIDLDDSDGIRTELGNPRAATLELEVQAGVEYTVIVQTRSTNQFILNWNSNVMLSPLGAADPGDTVACRSRISLTGMSGRQEYGTVPFTAEEFIGGSCASQDATNYALFGFVASGDGNVTVTVPVVEAAMTHYLSARTDCLSRQGEIDCVVTESTSELPAYYNLVSQQNGELPQGVVILSDLPSGGSDEGRAMAELLHDVAPGATLAFSTAFTGMEGFAEGILKLGGVLPIGENEFLRPIYLDSQVIVDDVIYSNEPVYQTGIVANAVKQVTQSRRRDGMVINGSSYFSSAGNSSNQALRAVFRDVDDEDDNNMPTSGRDLHRWSNDSGFLPVQVPPGGFFEAILQWNQPFTSIARQFGQTDLEVGCRVDMDLFVTLTPDGDGLEEANNFGVAQGRASRDTQGNNFQALGDPYEFVSYQNNTGSPQTVYIAVDHFDGNQDKIPQFDNVPLEFSLIFWTLSPGVKVMGIDEGDPSSGAATMWGHSMAEGAISVGAVNYYDTPAFDTTYGPTDAIDPEWFTSRGGALTTYFNETGNPVIRTTNEPDLAAVDGNNNSFFTNEFSLDFDLDGNPNFFGTSAAAPNAAGVAALMYQLSPSLNPTQLLAALKETAVDVTGFRAAPGIDDTTGAGLINATAAMDYVVEHYGLGVGDPAPEQVLITFASAEGWDFGAPGGDFTVPGYAVTGESLRLTAINNDNTFGWWRSPEFISARVVQPELITINGFEQGGTGTGPDQVYRVSFTVSSDAPDSAQTPGFRMRASTRNWEQTSELIVYSSGDGSLSPEDGAPYKVYRQYFTLPESQTRFRLFFDLFAFDPGDLSGANVNLENVLVQSFSINSLTDTQLERLFFFEGERNGWQVRHAPALGGVESQDTADGLVLGPVKDDTRTSFGYWASEDAKPPARLKKNRLYRAVFSVSSDIDPAMRDKLPSFRLRMNDGGNKMAAVLFINSSSLTSNVPAGGESMQYQLMFAAPDELVPEGVEGNMVKLAFDYLFVPESGDDASQKITLKTIRLDSFQEPIRY